MADTHDRVLFELLQELSHASACLLVSYTPLARFCGRICWSGVASDQVPVKDGFGMDINASANKKAETL